jgi:hypothetical protein
LYDEVETGRPSKLFEVISIQKGLEPYAIIDEQVQSVATAVNDVENSDVTVYAVRIQYPANNNFTNLLNPQSQQSYKLVIKRIRGESVMDTKEYSITDNCGTSIKLTKYAIVIGCASY